MPPIAYQPFDQVFIVGGTHGNERTGISLVRFWQQNPGDVQGATFTTELLLANPEAIRRNQRFIDVDLNRSFLPRQLGDPTSQTYEHQRARAIAEMLQTESARKRTFVIDLHTTTSRMGTTLISNGDPINLAIAAQAVKRLGSARIYCFTGGDRIDSCLRAVAHGGVGIEIGPIPQGLLRHDILASTREAVQAVLKTIDNFNRNGFIAPDPHLTVYRQERQMAYPDRPEGAPPAFIHRELEGRDFTALKLGQPIFQDLAGRVWTFDDPDTYYPVFINEAAYYHENIAFSLTRKMALASIGDS